MSASMSELASAELVNAERHRMARDLHDSVAQCLVAIGMHLEWCHRHVDPDSPAYERLVASKELARAGLGWVRSAVEELSGPEQPATGSAPAGPVSFGPASMGQASFGQALRELASGFWTMERLRVSVRIGGCEQELSPAMEHALFQIAQEGLWNVVRHAGASHAWLCLHRADGQVRLSVSDDGHGDPSVAGLYLVGEHRLPGEHGLSGEHGLPGEHGQQGRHGLRNIAERAAELGGEAQLGRRRGGGLRVVVRVPDPGSAP